MLLSTQVVSETDAYLEGADTQLLSGDHIGICKFRDDQSGRQRLEPVWKALKRLATGAHGRPGKLS